MGCGRSKSPKTYPALKTFFHEAYNRRLNAMDLQNTSGTLGYAPAQNMYNILDYGKDDDSTTDVSLNMPPTGVGTEAASTFGAGPSMANSACSFGYNGRDQPKHCTSLQSSRPESNGPATTDSGSICCTCPSCRTSPSRPAGCIPRATALPADWHAIPGLW